MKKIILPALLCAAGIALCGCENKSNVSVADASDTLAEQTEQSEQTEQTEQTDSITMEEAEQIAFTDAGINETDADGIKVIHDTEDGRNIFQVEFYDSKNEYEYEISSETGNIVLKSIEPRSVTVTSAAETSASSASEPETQPLDTTTVQPAVTGSASEKSRTAPASAAASAAKKLTESDAKKIAFDDAGVKEADVEFINVKPDRDDGRDVFDVEFYVDGTEYDYEIDAESGKILSFDKEVENLRIPQSTTAKQNSSANITESDAKKIAFDDAGVKEANVEFINVKPDRDDGRDVFDVEFYAGGTEYDYEIDAESGKILSFDKEVENLRIPQSTTAKQNGSANITEAEAKEIAFDDAGISASSAKRVKTEFDRDDGREIYEVEFYYNGLEYSYEINAADGRIIDKETDRD